MLVGLEFFDMGESKLRQFGQSPIVADEHASAATDASAFHAGYYKTGIEDG
jgi:hypothetical protein